jgi:hypothetical protein
MPTPESDKPEPFLDMTIPERTDKVPEPRPFLDMAIPERSANPAEPYRPPSGPAYCWKVSDRVLAPWEPNFLYTGRIAEIRDNQALVEFSDGGAGWVTLEQLRPFAVPKGQKVFCRRNLGTLFFPAEILDVRGEQVCVGFDDSQDDEWTTIAALRFPCQPLGPGATPTRAADQTPYYPQLGHRVWAPWNSATLFAGTVDQIKDQDVHIHFDDGDRGWVQVDQLLPLEIPVGLRVAGRWKMGGQFYPATVTKVEGDRIYLIYDDGDKEWTRPAALALVTQPFGPDARPTRNVNGGFRGSGMGWLVYVGIAIVIGILRAGCR